MDKFTLKPYTLKAGRGIFKNGKPFVAIHRMKSKEVCNGYDYPPTDADTLARDLVEWLNLRARVRAAKVN